MKNKYDTILDEYRKVDIDLRETGSVTQSIYTNDELMHTMTNTGNSTTSVLKLDGNGDYLTCDQASSNFTSLHNVGSKWTSKWWMKVTSFPVSYAVVWNTRNDSRGSQIYFYGSSSSYKLRIIIQNDSTPITAAESSANAVPTDGLWHYYEVQWDDTLGSANVKFFVDGVAKGTGNKSGTASNTAPQNTLIIGAAPGGGSSVNGYIEDLEILLSASGVAASVPTTQPTITTQKLVMLFNVSPFVDSSSNAFTFTASGDATTDTSTYPYGIVGTVEHVLYNPVKIDDLEVSKFVKTDASKYFESADIALADLPTMTSAEFATKISDETGTAGKLVFDTSPVLVTPTIGAAVATSIQIGANTLDTNEWAYLDGQNQAVKTTSSPTFADVTDSGLTASQAVMTDANKKLVSQDYLNQAVKSTSSPTFADVTDNGLTASKLVLTDANKKLVSSSYTDTAFVKKADTHFRFAVLDTPIAADVFPMFQFPYAVTLTKVTGTAKGGTSITFNLEERSATGLASAGTDTMTSDLAADTDGANTTSFSNASIAANAFLVFAGSALSGTVNQVVVMIEYTID